MPLMSASEQGGGSRSSSSNTAVKRRAAAMANSHAAQEPSADSRLQHGGSRTPGGERPVDSRLAGYEPPAGSGRPGYEVVETVEATLDLADQLDRLCPLSCQSGRRRRLRRPNSGGRKSGGQRLVIRYLRLRQLSK